MTSARIPYQNPGYVAVRNAAGALLPGRARLRAGSGVTVTDDPAREETVISAAGGGGGITQLTGSVLAGPGSGSQAAQVVQIDGAGGICRANVGYLNVNVDGAAVSLGHNPYGDPQGNLILARDAGGGELWLGADGAFNGGYRANNTSVAGYTGVHLGGGDRVAFSTARARSGSPYLNMVQFAQGVQFQRHQRAGAGSIDLDNIYDGYTSYFLEAAYAAGSGGLTVNMPATPWPEYQPGTPGRQFVVADVVGTCSAGDPIVLQDPTGRTFGAVAGPLTITKAFASVTLALDSTLNNWILMFQGGAAI